MDTIDKLRVEQVNKMFEKTKNYEIGEYEKSAKTLLRLPKEEEIGQEFSTFVLKDGEIVKETSNIKKTEIIENSLEKIKNSFKYMVFADKKINNEFIINSLIVIKEFLENKNNENYETKMQFLQENFLTSVQSIKPTAKDLMYHITIEKNLKILKKSIEEINNTKQYITDDIVIAQNPGFIGVSKDGEEIYNSYIINKEKAKELYGTLPTKDEFVPMKKIAKIQAIEVTNEIYKDLKKFLDKDESGNLLLPVDWSPEPMVFGKGDFITNQGYSINKAEMEKTYEKVQDLGKKPIKVEGLYEIVNDYKVKVESKGLGQ